MPSIPLAALPPWSASHYGLDLERIPVLHTGVDTELFRPVDVPKADRPTVNFVGKLVENKGAELLLEAAITLTGVSGLAPAHVRSR